MHKYQVYTAPIQSTAMTMPLFDRAAVLSTLNYSAFTVATKPDAPTLPKLSIQETKEAKCEVGSTPSW